MSKLSGFPEFLPAERNVELVVLDHLRSVFELHGFASIETRAAEPMDALLRKGEIDKEVYVLRRLQAGDGDSDSGLGLHFDLTVPFARYVVENASRLEFPFRRYQVQKVWRGERPQQGRFREFLQADIDIVAKDELAFHFDVEVAQVMAEALSGLPVPALTLQVSNRKVLEGFYLGLGIAEPTTVMQVVDKLDKMPADRIAELLQSDAGLTAEQAAQCLALAQIRSADTSFVRQVLDLGVSHPLLDEGLDELAQVVTGASGASGVEVVADLRIARGLDYYTGTVSSDGRATYPGVGISLGVSRLLVPLVADGLIADRSVPSAVFVALADEDSRPASVAVARSLRSRGIPTEVAATAQKYGKQIRNAERRGIPFVWFPATADAPHQVKDIRSGVQHDADPAAWSPPAADLKPHILERPSKEQHT